MQPTAPAAKDTMPITLTPPPMAPALPMMPMVAIPPP